MFSDLEFGKEGAIWLFSLPDGYGSITNSGLEGGGGKKAGVSLPRESAAAC